MRHRRSHTKRHQKRRDGGSVQWLRFRDRAYAVSEIAKLPFCSNSGDISSHVLRSFLTHMQEGYCVFPNSYIALQIQPPFFFGVTVWGWSGDYLRLLSFRKNLKGFITFLLWLRIQQEARPGQDTGMAVLEAPQGSFKQDNHFTSLFLTICVSGSESVTLHLCGHLC